MNSKLISVLLFLFLSGCQTFTSTIGSVSKSFEKAQSYPTLNDFGDKGGEVIVAIYDRDVFPERLRIPKADRVTEKKNESAKTLKLGSFVTRSGLFDSRTNPLLEIGALYYFPNRFNHNTERSGKVIQKVCETVDDHGVDNAIILDEPSGIISDRRKFLLDGSIDAKLIKSLSGLSANAEAKYLFEFQILESRLRSINPKDGKVIKQILLDGEKCRTKFIPKIGKNTLYQLTSKFERRKWQGHFFIFQSLLG